MTGREDEFQLEVPIWLRNCVPARYGVELVKSDDREILIISDQKSNLHVDSEFDGRLVAICQFIDTSVAFLKRAANAVS